MNSSRTIQMVILVFILRANNSDGKSIYQTSHYDLSHGTNEKSSSLLSGKAEGLTMNHVKHGTNEQTRDHVRSAIMGQV